jgi:UDP-3-O-[3-hydroxymyristoyl] glucosamine N-acyltransferase
MSFVNRPVDEAGVYSSGMPLMDNRAWRKNMARLKQLDELARRLAALEKRCKGR